MSLPIEPILGILADNLKRRGSVMPMSAQKTTAWARGLGLPWGGKTVLYTGHMYQLMPAIQSLSRMMAKMESNDSWKIRWMGLGRKINRFVNTSGFMARPDAAEESAFNRRLANIADLLKKAGKSFGYLYEEELYAGALIYDQGMDDVFEAHARRLYGILKKNCVQEVITVDPHTTHMLRQVYPEIIPGYDIQVKSYLEVLAEAGIRPVKALDGEVVIHDSCVYARYESVIDQPRTLLDRTGLHLAEIENAGKFTYCCGGPIESLFPKKAKAVAEARLDQLKSSGCGNVVSMCPICLVNLRHAANGNGVKVHDVSEYLHEAYCAN